MAKIPSKVESRIKEALKRYQPLVEPGLQRQQLLNDPEVKHIAPAILP